MYLAAALLLGFMGSAHCVGMCGPLVLAMPYGRGKKRHVNMSVYHLMRSVMYGLMGLLIGLLGVGFHLAGWQSPISIAAGLMVIVIGLWQLIGNGKFKVNVRSQRIFKLRQRFLSKPGGTGKNAVLGFLNGLLPCGLVYTALAASIAAGGLWESALFMFIFGIATIPALYVLGFLPSIFPGFKSQNLQRFIPAITIIVGVLFVLRGLELGIPFLSPPSEALSVENPACCSKPME
jgi:sulfite exporter TauE/SafE